MREISSPLQQLRLRAYVHQDVVETDGSFELAIERAIQNANLRDLESALHYVQELLARAKAEPKILEDEWKSLESDFYLAGPKQHKLLFLFLERQIRKYIEDS